MAPELNDIQCGSGSYLKIESIAEGAEQVGSPPSDAGPVDLSQQVILQYLLLTRLLLALRSKNILRQ